MYGNDDRGVRLITSPTKDDCKRYYIISTFISPFLKAITILKYHLVKLNKVKLNFAKLVGLAKFSRFKACFTNF